MQKLKLALLNDPGGLLDICLNKSLLFSRESFLGRIFSSSVEAPVSPGGTAP